MIIWKLADKGETSNYTYKNGIIYEYEIFLDSLSNMYLSHYFFKWILKNVSPTSVQITLIQVSFRTPALRRQSPHPCLESVCLASSERSGRRDIVLVKFLLL